MSVRSRFFRILIFCTLSSNIHAQYTIHGTVYDQSTGEHLVAATLYDTLSQSGVVSNEYGFFSLKTSKPKVELIYSNIEGGFGLLTASSQLTSTIDMSEWYYDPDFLELLGK